MNNQEYLFYAIGNIEDDFVTDAYEAVTKTKGYHSGIRKIAVIALIVIMIGIPLRNLIHNENTSGDIQPMIYVYETVYGLTGNVSDYENDRDLVYIGVVVSAVDSDEYPNEELQTNDIELIGADVYSDGNKILIYRNDCYLIYEKLGN